MAETSIEWTQRPGTDGATWNPTVGCTEISPGCKHCYARTMHGRLTGMGAARVAKATTPAKRAAAEKAAAKYRDPFHVVKPWADALDLPLTVRRPTTYFVNSMSDLFHKDVPDGYIQAVFGVMAACRRHTFQILTKRAERMAEFFARGDTVAMWQRASERAGVDARHFSPTNCERPPLDNVWIGVSVESQEYADERIPHLLATPAAVRFVSYEPALGGVDFAPFLPSDRERCAACLGSGCELDAAGLAVMSSTCRACGGSGGREGIRWLIYGGESGARARPNDIAWGRAARDQCRAAGVPFFWKQHGSNVEDAPLGVRCRIRLRHPKGNDPAEWPEDCRVREWPEVRT